MAEETTAKTKRDLMWEQKKKMREEKIKSSKHLFLNIKHYKSIFFIFNSIHFLSRLQQPTPKNRTQLFKSPYQFH